jgi:hypothetical protein
MMSIGNYSAHKTDTGFSRVGLNRSMKIICEPPVPPITKPRRNRQNLTLQKSVRQSTRNGIRRIQQSIADAAKWRQENSSHTKSLFLLVPLIAVLILIAVGVASLFVLRTLRKQTTKPGLYLSAITGVIFIFILPLGLISIQQGTQESPLLLKGLIVGDIILAVPLCLSFLYAFLSLPLRNTEGKAIPCRAYVALELVLLSFVVSASFGLFMNLISSGERAQFYYFKPAHQTHGFVQDCITYEVKANDAVNKITAGFWKQSQEAVKANDGELSEKNEAVLIQR